MRGPAGLLLVVAIGACALSVRGADWPQWRGPNRDGLSQEKGLLKQWPAEGPKLVWQLHDIGSGYSTPAIVGQRLYLMSNRGTDNEFVQALKVIDGSQEWSTRVGNVGANKGPQYPGARCTPTVDGERIYALGSDGDLVCLETATGSVRWQKNLRSDFGGRPGNWAYAESPLVDGDALICTPGGDTTMAALNKHTGDVIWKCAAPEAGEAAYASVTIVQAAGAKQYVQFLQKGVVGVEAGTGKFLWRYGKTAEGSPSNIPTPVARDAYIYNSTNRGGSALLQLRASGDKVEADEVYYQKGLPTAIGGAVLIGDYLYGTSGTALMCVEFAAGNIKWQERSPIAPGAVCYAEGRVYIHGEKGDVALVEATPEAFREKGRFTPPDQPDRGKAQAWAYPVVSNGRLYIRDLGKLWCYDVKE